MKLLERFAEPHTASQIMPCPRCKHLSRFQQAPSDHAWVCQCCLRVRVQTVGDRGRDAQRTQPAAKRV